MRLYLEHVEGGLTIRALAREKGCHASTILRQVQKTEKRRDDPLVDSMLTDLGRLRRDPQAGATSSDTARNQRQMNDQRPDEETLKREAVRLLRTLMKEGAVMAVTPNVDTAVIVVEDADGRPVIHDKCDRTIAQAMAVKEWISGKTTGKVARYHIAPAGRVVLNRLLAERESDALGFAEAPAGFTGATPVAGFFGKGHHARLDTTRTRGRSVGTESPVRVLGRRIDVKTRKPYLDPALVQAAERLQRDFEMAQLDATEGLDWDRLMSNTGGTKRGGDTNARRLDARSRFEAAMAQVQPELGDLLVRVCCQEQGMEQIEADLEMPARSGKFMLRVALCYLDRHYQAQSGDDHDLIY
ncbi:DUF6456 domain-containing protein [Aliiroseovarius subalbicans]|uniref:DUF6456 domain-containing protein n=1 Tax=Aliiroseovarius subalbicans TaxID=2925840 RepID=UPI001F5A59BA|nr:DUF6456 domain-containing protein [Aliiroseovarius subalbicans]MCI2398416.1 DUF6456 domain-containing protein [Aliiroseovarius subalbicans]